MHTPGLTKRGSKYYFRASIPIHLQPAFKGKKERWISLRTSDHDTALIRYVFENNKFAAHVRGIEADRLPFPDTSMTPERLLSMLGLKPIHMSITGNESATAVFEAIEPNVRLVKEWSPITSMHVAALAATVKSSLSWKDFLDRYKKLDRDHFSAKQDRRAKDKRYTPKSNAIATFVGWFPKLSNVLAVTRQDALEFKDRLLDLVDAGTLKSSTAYKKLVHLRTVFEKVFDADYRELKNPFKDVSIKVHEIGKRDPFSEEDIATICAHFENCGASSELKAVNYISMYTGAHQKELVFLTSADIHLNAVIPYIRVAENEFRDKVKHGGARHRDLPLVGKALEWAQKFPNGFPKYCKSGGADNLSAASNKHLKPLTGKTFYGYRHRIADVLRNSGCNDSLKDSIMGHKTPGIGAHYGTGYTLAKKREALVIALGISENKENCDEQ